LATAGKAASQLTSSVLARVAGASSISDHKGVQCNASSDQTLEETKTKDAHVNAEAGPDEESDATEAASLTAAKRAAPRVLEKVVSTAACKRLVPGVADERGAAALVKHVTTRVLRRHEAADLARSTSKKVAEKEAALAALAEERKSILANSGSLSFASKKSSEKVASGVPLDAEAAESQSGAVEGQTASVGVAPAVSSSGVPEDGRGCLQMLSPSGRSDHYTDDFERESGNVSLDLNATQESLTMLDEAELPDTPVESPVYKRSLDLGEVNFMESVELAETSVDFGEAAESSSLVAGNSTESHVEESAVYTEEAASGRIGLPDKTEVAEDDGEVFNEYADAAEESSDVAQAHTT